MHNWRADGGLCWELCACDEGRGEGAGSVLRKRRMWIFWHCASVYMGRMLEDLVVSHA